MREREREREWPWLVEDMTADGDGLEILSKGLEIFEANRANGLDNALATQSHHISLIFGDHISLCFFLWQPSVTSVSYIFYSVGVGNGANSWSASGNKAGKSNNFTLFGSKIQGYAVNHIIIIIIIILFTLIFISSTNNDLFKEKILE